MPFHGRIDEAGPAVGHEERALLPLEIRERGLHGGDEPADRYVEERANLLGARREDVRGDAARGVRGPLDDRDRTEGSAGLVHDPADRGGVAEIGHEGLSLHPLGLQGLHAVLQLLGAASDDRDLKPFGAELLGNRSRDAGAVTSHEDSLLHGPWMITESGALQTRGLHPAAR